MNNTEHCQGKTLLIWQELIREAKLRLLDATEKPERGEWRRSVKVLELLRDRNVALPGAAYASKRPKKKAATQ